MPPFLLIDVWPFLCTPYVLGCGLLLTVFILVSYGAIKNAKRKKEKKEKKDFRILKGADSKRAVTLVYIKRTAGKVKNQDQR